MNRIGVSPAFFVSLYSSRFTMADFLEGLDKAGSLGFESFQMEIYHAKQLDEWNKDSAARINDKAGLLSLKTSAIVGHYLMEDFNSAEKILDNSLHGKITGFLEKIRYMPPETPVVVPLPPMEGVLAPDETAGCVEVIGEIIDLCREYGRKAAFEIMADCILAKAAAEWDGASGAKFSGSEEMRGRVNNVLSKVSILYDTRHINNIAKSKSTASYIFNKNIAATHFGDFTETASGPLLPGSGLIDWNGVLKILRSADYGGSIDIDIAVNRPSAEKEILESYGKGRKYILEKLNLYKEDL